MSNQPQPETREVGITALPKGWAIAVQLVGTFGLAVFLVLYYVLVMQPREAERYEQLRDTVASLEELITSQQSLLTRAQASRLEDLYVMAMAPELAALITAELQANPTADALARQIEDKLIFETRLLQGLRRKDGGVLSEMLTHKIRNRAISQEIAQRAVADWQDADSEAIAAQCREALSYAINRAAMAK